ncbi:MAG: O-antigen ligase family protein, partial [Nitrospirales bacterium]
GHQSFQWLLVLLGYAALLYLLVSCLTGWRQVVGFLVLIFVVAGVEAGLAIAQGGWLKAQRPAGTFFNPNFLAGYLAAAGTILLGIIGYRLRWRDLARLSRTRSQLLSLGLLCLLSLLLVAILWTGSRGAGLALLGGLALVLGCRFGRKMWGLLLLGLMMTVLLPNPIRDRFVDEYERNPVGYARWEIWKSSAKAILDHPAGVGLGLYQYVSPRYSFPINDQITRYGTVARRAHSEYLQMAVELGVLSLGLFAWGVVMVFREAGRAARQRLRRWQRGLVVGTMGAVATILLHAFVEANLHSPAVAILLTVCVAMLLAVRRLGHPQAGNSHHLLVRHRSVWLGIVVLIVGAFAVESVRLGVGFLAYESGSRALRNSEFTEALSHFERAVSWDPGAALYHSSLGAAHFQVFLRTHQPESAKEALAQLRLATSLNPLDGRLVGLSAHVYATLASSLPQSVEGSEPLVSQRVAWLTTAQSLYQRALKLEPYSPFYRLELGKLHLVLDDPGQAEAVVQDAIALEPNFLPARLWLAERYLGTGRVEEARTQFGQILQRHRRYAEAPKNSIEERYLAVDVSTVEATLQRMAEPV